MNPLTVLFTLLALGTVAFAPRGIPRKAKIHPAPLPPHDFYFPGTEDLNLDPFREALQAHASLQNIAIHDLSGFTIHQHTLRSQFLLATDYEPLVVYENTVGQRRLAVAMQIDPRMEGVRMGPNRHLLAFMHLQLGGDGLRVVTTKGYKVLSGVDNFAGRIAAADTAHLDDFQIGKVITKSEAFDLLRHIH